MVTMPTDRKTLWLYGGGAVAGAVVWKHFRNKQTAVAAPVDTTATDTGTGTDTGSYGDYSAASGHAVGMNGSAYTFNGPVAAADNHTWAQNAQTYLTGVGYDSQTVSTALGAFLNGRPLTAEQGQIRDAAIAFEGPPPVAVPTSPTATNTGQSSTQLATPVAGISGQHGTTKTMSWNPVPGANLYQIHIGAGGLLAGSVTGHDFNFPAGTGPYTVVAIDTTHRKTQSGYSNPVN